MAGTGPDASTCRKDLSRKGLISTLTNGRSHHCHLFSERTGTPWAPTSAEEGKMRVGGAPTLYRLCSVVTCLLQPLLRPPIQWLPGPQSSSPRLAGIICFGANCRLWVLPAGYLTSLQLLVSLPLSLWWKWKKQALGSIHSCSSARGCPWEEGMDEACFSGLPAAHGKGEAQWWRLPSLSLLFFSFSDDSSNSLYSAYFVPRCFLSTWHTLTYSALTMTYE